MKTLVAMLIGFAAGYLVGDTVVERDVKFWQSKTNEAVELAQRWEKVAKDWQKGSENWESAAKKFEHAAHSFEGSFNHCLSSFQRSTSEWTALVNGKRMQR